MYVGAGNFAALSEKKRIILITIVIYSIISALLIGFKIIKPF